MWKFSNGFCLLMDREQCDTWHSEQWDAQCWLGPAGEGMLQTYQWTGAVAGMDDVFFQVGVWCVTLLCLLFPL